MNLATSELKQKATAGKLAVWTDENTIFFRGRIGWITGWNGPGITGEGCPYAIYEDQIAKINSDHRTITLTDGRVYHLDFDEWDSFIAAWR